MLQANSANQKNVLLVYNNGEHNVKLKKGSWIRIILGEKCIE